LDRNNNAGWPQRESGLTISQTGRVPVGRPQTEWLYDSAELADKNRTMVHKTNQNEIKEASDSTAA